MQRPEYPRPQMVRDAWMNLNGAWEYRTDRGVSGTDRKWFLPDAEFPEAIEVPFCRESVLSGIGDTDFCPCVWYRKRITLPDAWEGKRVLLQVGACDFETTLWVDGKEVGTHIGGYVAFSFDLTDYLSGKEATLTLRVKDDVRLGKQAAGKQSTRYGSYGCFYTRTTGIWQTVWLEAVEQAYIVGTKYYPDIDAGTLTVMATVANAEGMTLSAKAFYEGKTVGEATATVNGRQAILTLALSELHLWEIGNGRLYDLALTLGEDSVKSYFGMRSVGVKDGFLYLNHKPVFQRLVLDQGFYPDGIYTAPSEQALIDDITRSMACGFNGARLHQKVFEPVFLYHCDRLGYMVWGEFGNWGLSVHKPEAWKGFVGEWIEIVKRDRNHPAIIGWCPFNETPLSQDDDLIAYGVKLTKELDSTRPVIDTSGWIHVKDATDIMDWHDYDQNPETFNQRYLDVANGTPIFRRDRMREPIIPRFISEYGGIKWDINSNLGNAWGYGDAPKTEEEFISRFKGLAEALLFNPFITGLCYTQLTDVEQEVNGLYTYDRQTKFDPAIFYEILTQKAAIED